MKNNWLLCLIARLLPPRAHRLVSRITGWMYAAVWVRSEQKHIWMWVNEKQYYAGVQSVETI